MENTVCMLLVMVCGLMITPPLVWMAIDYRRELKKEKESFHKKGLRLFSFALITHSIIERIRRII